MDTGLSQSSRGCLIVRFVKHYDAMHLLSPSELYGCDDDTDRICRWATFLFSSLDFTEAASGVADDGQEFALVRGFHLEGDEMDRDIASRGGEGLEGF